MTWAAMQPRDGDRVASCAHREGGHHWFHLGDGYIEAPDGCRCHWVHVCERCFERMGGPERFDPSVIVRHGSWTGDEPAIEVDPLHVH